MAPTDDPRARTDTPQTDDHGCPEPPHEAGEAATLLGFLDYQRATFEWKCRGLSDEQLRIALPPTSMTLGGMLKHLALNEEYWCTEVTGGQPRPTPSTGPEIDADPDWDWHSADADTGEELRALWAERVSKNTLSVPSSASFARRLTLICQHRVTGFRWAVRRGPGGVRSWWATSLISQVLRRGCLLSELPPSAPKAAPGFTRRHQILAALADKTVIGEAELGAGALTTGEQAHALNRRLGATPALKGTPAAAGYAYLTQHCGAHIVDTADDIDYL